MRNEEIKKMTFAAILMAMIVVFSLLYLIPISITAAITIAHIPVIIGAIKLGPKYGTALGFVFGLVSMIIASFELGPHAPFTNPLLSVLPRMFFGWVIYYVYLFFKNLIKKRSVSLVVTSIVSTFIHSFVVLVIYYFVVKYNFYFTASENPLYDGSSIVSFILGIFTINGLIEMVSAAVVAPAAVMVLDQLGKFNME